MPKTRDAFAFRIIEYGLELEARAKELSQQGNNELAMELTLQTYDLLFVPFQHKGAQEPYQQDRIKSIEQSIEDCSKDLRRAKFLLSRLDVHDRRLQKFLSKSDEVGDRARILADKYNDVRKAANDFIKFVVEAKRLNEETLRAAFNEELGVRLRLSRKKKKYTQAFVAEVLGITREAYSHYEVGRREIPPVYIYRLANLFDVSKEYLIGLEEINPPIEEKPPIEEFDTPF